MREFIKSNFKLITKIIRNFKIKKRIKYEYIKFKSNWLYSKKTKDKIGYGIILESHSIEKGMTNKQPRFFGINKVNTIIDYLNDYDTNNWEHDYAYELGVSILIEYCKFYENNNWTSRKEYIDVKNFIKGKKSKVSSGIYNISKTDFINDALIDYNKFLSSRHSFREYLRKDILSSDIEKAVKMAALSPSACNRQMCKIYYAKRNKNKIIKYSHGLTNFDNESVNLFVITYDISSLCDFGEINQGMFNAGLFCMNFVNALHSMGIGSCILEYNDSKEEEIEMKKILNIPNNETIAVVIAAGYYPEKSIITKSARKPIKEIYREV